MRRSMTVEAQPPVSPTLQDIQSEAYARLQLSEFASLSQIVKAIKRREDSRQFFNANTAADVNEASVIYEATVAKGIQNELSYCLQLAEFSPLEALQTLTDHLKVVQDLPMSESSVEKLDKAFFDVALETLVDDDASSIEKAAGVTLALQFGAVQRGVAKTQMILEERLTAEQTARLHHINQTSRQAANQRLQALESFFEFAGLEYQAEAIDSTLSTSAQKATELTKKSIERSKQAIGDGTKLGQKAASVTVLASMGIVGGASMAAAETPASTQTVGATSAEAAIVAQAITSNKQALEVSVLATVETVESTLQAATIETPTTPMVSVEGAVASVDVSSTATSSVINESETVPTPVVDVVPAVTEVPELSQEEETKLAPSIAPEIQDTQKPAFVEAAPSVEPEIVDQATHESVAPATVVAPNSDVNVAVGETPQEALARIVASRDMNAASYALRKLYSTTPDQAPANETLSTLIATDVATLRILISEAAHSDPAYTEKAFHALAYLDAVAHSPALLDNAEVAAFVASITDQGEGYRKKLFAQYLAEAKTALSAETAGAYNGVAEQYRAPIEALYAYAAMAGVSDQKQAEQIEAIKAEEVRIAAEEEAKRIATEQAQQGLTPIEIIANDEKQLVLGAIDRSLQQGLITQKYADVLRLVIEQEGPSALIAAAGMVGNCMAEADGCNPVIVERGNGIGFGIFQWSFGRRTTLERTAAEQGIDVGDIGFQVRYAIAESKARAQRDDKSLNEWQGLLEQTDPAAAAEFWRWNYERPKEHLSRASTRVQVAQEVYTNVVGQMEGLKGEAAAAKTAREAEIERQRQVQLEQERVAEEARRTVESQGDMRSQLANGKEIREHLKAKYNDVSGQLDPSELAGVPGINNHGKAIEILLHPEAAKGYQALAAAFKAHFGVDVQITDHYRNLQGQHNVKRDKGKYAATPGKSLHGWGLAIDFASDINKEGSPQHEWMEQNAHKYGWVNPTWAHDGKGIEEPWHWEFDGNQASFKVNN